MQSVVGFGWFHPNVKLKGTWEPGCAGSLWWPSLSWIKSFNRWNGKDFLVILLNKPWNRLWDQPPGWRGWQGLVPRGADEASGDGEPAWQGTRGDLSQCAVDEPCPQAPRPRGAGRRGSKVPPGACWPLLTGAAPLGLTKDQSWTPRPPIRAGLDSGPEKPPVTLWVTDTILLQVTGERLIRQGCWGTNDSQWGEDLFPHWLQGGFLPNTEKVEPRTSRSQQGILCKSKEQQSTSNWMCTLFNIYYPVPMRMQWRGTDRSPEGAQSQCLQKQFGGLIKSFINSTHSRCTHCTPKTLILRSNS